MVHFPDALMVPVVPVGGEFFYLWLVHPGLQTLEVYRLEGQHWVVASSHVGAESVRAEPFETVELDMSRWWLEEA